MKLTTAQETLAREVFTKALGEAQWTLARATREARFFADGSASRLEAAVEAARERVANLEVLVQSTGEGWV